ncbi:dachs ligand with SH3s [Brevipalpus obovatus]|uniref:dachs ligand with SH3s n=1 Tax=Brevipalpus obovatus TaxID=246614 RepID=UPI003D9E35DA
MALLCPVHRSKVWRSKKKSKDSDKVPIAPANIGRITGSASIETLIRVGLEKENGLAPDSKMVVLHDFTPCVDDELEVKRGQIVNILYQENDWVYVIGDDGREGFIPHSYCTSYCTPLDSQLATIALNVKHKKETNDSDICLDSSKDSDQDQLNSSEADSRFASSSSVEVHPFFKVPSGHHIVLFTFIARDENDVSVERGESVTVLNREDPDWFWVVRSDGQEGFVPSAFVCPLDMVQDQSLTHPHTATTSISASNINASSSCNFLLNNNNNNNHDQDDDQNDDQNDCSNSLNKLESTGIGNLVSGNHGHTSTPNLTTASQESDGRFCGTELVMLYDYKAQAPDDLNVLRGDFLYANLSNQNVDGWLWAFAPKHNKYGFIPKAYARPPAMTFL